MALEIIGSGFGRTGTRSLKDALEILGFGPCHHMADCFANPEQVATWQSLARGEPQDWKAYFADYRAQVDWPGAHVWRETLAAFPEARVLHSQRPEESWWRSFSHTIGKLNRVYPDLEMSPHGRAMLEAFAEGIAKPTFPNGTADKEGALAAYRQRAEEVKAAIPPERLLVFDVAEGWEPLCAFLGVPVPDQPFPRRNDGDGFWQGFGGEPDDPDLT